jgi:hypothetical protein
VIVTYPIWITAYWRDKENRVGRETLRVASRQPWGGLLKPTELVAARASANFERMADHFETPKDLPEHGVRSAKRRVRFSSWKSPVCVR